MMRKEGTIFLVVGGLTVGVDFLSYSILLWLGVYYAWAKGTGFIIGTIFSYFANRHWTFGHIDQAPKSLPRFVSLYAVTLAANVLINQAVLSTAEFEVTLAFLLATGVSALMNFLGMKFFVFKRQ